MNTPFSPERAPDVSELNRYWSDPKYRARKDRETAHARALAREHWDATQIAKGNRWPHHWTQEEQDEATAKLMASYAELWAGYGQWHDDQNTINTAPMGQERN